MPDQWSAKDDSAKSSGLGTRIASRFAGLRLRGELAALPPRSLRPISFNTQSPDSVRSQSKAREGPLSRR
jgi:hypothetical protein